MVAMFSGIPVRRMSRKVASSATSDGSMAITRAAPLRKTTRKATKSPPP
jgi:hypothetical protein